MGMLEDILTHFEEITGVINTDIIPREKIDLWMQSNDMEVLGAVRYLILDKRYYMRINPPLSIYDYQKFLLPYYERCILENPDGKWSETRYEAGWSIVNWFIHLWDDKSVSRQVIKELKIWIEKLYKQGNEEVRKCIVTATLEHLFVKKKIAKYFIDWREDDTLCHGYNEAMGYSEKIKVKK